MPRKKSAPQPAAPDANGDHAQAATPMRREAGTYLPMGIDEAMLVRMQRPLRREFEQLYDDVYGALPRPGLGAFITFLATEGAEVMRRRYARH